MRPKPTPHGSPIASPGVARRWRVSDQALSPEFSTGWVAIDGDGLEEAVRVADERMYEAKRRRAKRREQATRRESAAKSTVVAKAPSKRRDRRSSPGHPAVGSA